MFNFEAGLYWDDFTRKVMKDVLDEKLRGAAVDVDARRKHLALVEAAAASGAEVLAFP